MKFKYSGKCIELDLYIPSLSVAFEVQGIQHYEDTEYMKMERALDFEKKELCRNAGIHLIPVPYTWDKREETLLATVKKQYPPLLSQICTS